MSTPEETEAKITENKRRIYALETGVIENKKNAYLNKSMAMADMHLIMRNREAAFGGNRQLANVNTDNIFANKRAILHALPEDTDVQRNFKNALLNKVKLEFLDHRSELNEKVIEVNMYIMRVNEDMIEINKRIMDLNEEIVNFNKGMIDENKKWLDDGVSGSENPTAEKNAAIVTGNARRIDKIEARMKKNAGLIMSNKGKILECRNRIDADTKDIYERRDKIMANAKNIKKNRERVVELF